MDYGAGAGLGGGGGTERRTVAGSEGVPVGMRTRCSRQSQKHMAWFLHPASQGSTVGDASHDFPESPQGRLKWSRGQDGRSFLKTLASPAAVLWRM